MSTPEECKACLCCEHFRYDPAVFYSSWTGGDNASWNCNKGHYSCREPGDKKEMQELVAKAPTCPDFEWDRSITR